MPKRILLVDDSTMVRQLVHTYLENRLDYVVCSDTVDGPDAISRAREVEPDLIILGLSVPKLNGLEAAAALHDTMPMVPIILYTLHENIVPVNQSQDAGIRAVISKSDPIQLLLDEVSNCVGVVRTETA